MYESRTYTRIVGTGTSLPTVASGVAYVGPGDIVSGALGWWGLRAYSAATVGANCVRLRRTNDNAEMDFATLSDGAVNAAAIASFAGGNELRCVTLYDQSGNSLDVTQSDTAAQFLVEQNASPLANLPALTGVGGNTNRLVSTNTITQSQPFSTSGVARVATAGTAVIFANAAGGIFLAWVTLDAAIRAGGSNVETPLAIGWHSLQGVYNGAGSTVYVDSTSNTGDPGSSTFSASAVVVGAFDSTGTLSLNGNLVEIGLWGSNISGSTAAIYANQSAFWGGF